MQHIFPALLPFAITRETVELLTLCQNQKGLPDSTDVASLSWVVATDPRAVLLTASTLQTLTEHLVCRAANVMDNSQAGAHVNHSNGL